jgi:hypothetical protein
VRVEHPHPLGHAFGAAHHLLVTHLRTAQSHDALPIPR